MKYKADFQQTSCKKLQKVNAFIRFYDYLCQPSEKLISCLVQH
ncbi:hypothetical protein HMPREF0971_00564 [Segatella oris F0302]|uniref:Uncharacterized protein n=1 Tax=Segatella oris F0302 TaxID=649760 RepID=D1QNR4_9BACT|nr:hypothetical protein HMPREF0971_00564 [Segatella oris F0302]